MEIKIQIIRSARRTLALEVRRDGSVVARAPWMMSRSKIDAFIQEKMGWIEKHVAGVGALARSGGCFAEGADGRADEGAAGRTMDAWQKEVLREEARRDLTARVAHWAAVMGVAYSRVTIKFQKSRWGSCSSKGNINLNAALMKCPEEVRDYVVIHELAHRREMNHSSRFWAIVEKFCPEYRSHRKYLRDNGRRLISGC